MPRLPVDSATSCSSHRPRPGQRRIDQERQLVAALLRKRAQGCTQPHACRERVAGAGRPRGVKLVAVDGRLPGCRRRRRAAPARRSPSARPARSRTRTAPSSVRRCRGRRGTRALKRCSCASSSRPEPGSVIATKLAPPGASEKKCANSDSGSIVPPDLEETMNSVRGRVDRALHGRDRGGVGRVEHDAGAPRQRTGPKQRLSTSGASEEPPMPSRTTSRRPSACTCSANSVRSSGPRRSMRVGDRQPAEAIGDLRRARRAPQRRVRRRLRGRPIARERRRLRAQPLENPRLRGLRELAVHRRAQ